VGIALVLSLEKKRKKQRKEKYIVYIIIYNIYIYNNNIKIC